MKTTLKTGLAAMVLLLAISCKKENSIIPSYVETNNTSSHALLTALDKPVIPGDFIMIGTQKWMLTNLNVSRYRNGELIPQVTDTAAWAALKTGAWCWYNNDSATYGATYGKLYNWYAVNDPRGLAPTGWHIPSDVEWITLSIFLGGDAVAGGKMKEAGTNHWKSPNTNATNSSGFTALPAGIRRGHTGTFTSIGRIGNWWSSTLKPGTRDAWYISLNFNSGAISSGGRQRAGLSVRCLKDSI